MTEPDPVEVAVESALTPSVAEAAAEVDAWTRAMADRAINGWDFVSIGPGPDLPRLRLRSLRVLTEHAYATGPVCDGTNCEQGGAAHCHRCAEVEADKLLAERDQLRAIAEEHLAWTRDQVEQTAAKFDQWADREQNIGLRMCMQFAARVMRAEFLGEYDGQQANGRFAARPVGAAGVGHDAVARETAERTPTGESIEP